jgi:hypothetical protein
MKENLYDSVAVKGSASPQRAYACTNRMEFFAELSVAYLWGQRQFRPEEKSQGHDIGMEAEAKHRHLRVGNKEEVKKGNAEKEVELEAQNPLFPFNKW